MVHNIKTEKSPLSGNNHGSLNWVSALLPIRPLKGMLQPIFCIDINTYSENEKLCKISFKKLFFQNILAFIDLFYRYIISLTSIQYVVKQPREVFFKKRCS